MSKVELIHGDCLEKTREIPSGSIDLVLADPPYGTTACKWDSVIPFEQMWEMLRRVTKENAAIVLFGSQPFSSALVASNFKMFKYEFIWIKNTQTGMMSAGKAPMKKHESILVFYRKPPTFNETKILGSLTSQNHAKKGYRCKNKSSTIYNVDGEIDFSWNEHVHSNSILFCNVVGNRDKERCHPSQKPIALLEYLIRTYTNEGEVVLDFAMGSGSTGVACKRLNRDFVGIEIESEYFEIANRRISEGEDGTSVMGICL